MNLFVSIVPLKTLRKEDYYPQRRNFGLKNGGTKFILICQSTFARYLLTVSRPISTASVLFDHRTSLSPVFNIYTALFLSKLLFIVCCTAFSLHICLFTRGAILLGIESAPLSEDEDEALKYDLDLG